MKKQIKVVGAAILNQKQDKILVAKRASNRILHYMWEFPGGKIEANETPKQALQREIKEELNVNIEVGPQVGRSTEFEYDFGVVQLTVFYAKLQTHDFKLVAHSSIKWVSEEELANLSWPKADEEIVEELGKQKLEDINFAR